MAHQRVRHGGRFSTSAPLAHPKKLRKQRNDKGRPRGTPRKKVDPRELWEGGPDDGQDFDLEKLYRYVEGYDWYGYEGYYQDGLQVYSSDQLKELWEREQDELAGKALQKSDRAKAAAYRKLLRG